MEQMSTRGLISIIVPVYNVESFLGKCIDSIIAQTYRNLEIILVDDGSTDKSGEICDAYRSSDKRVKIIHKRNGGAASARNRGLEIAQGEYIGFVDSDDYMDEDMYELLIRYMDKDVDIVACGRYVIYPPKSTGLNHKILCTDKITKFDRMHAIGELLEKRIFEYGVCDKIYRRELFDDVRFPNGRFAEDLPVTYALFKKSRNVVSIGVPRYYYFQRYNSTCRSEFFYRKMDYVFFLRDIFMDVKVEYPQFEKLAESKYIDGVVSTLINLKESSIRDQYIDLERRLKKLLRRMSIRIMCNQYYTKEQKYFLIRLSMEM